MIRIEDAQIDVYKRQEYGKNTNLITRKLTNQEWQEALTLMKIHQMLEVPCAIVNVEDHTPLYIYSTVNIYCKTADINELVDRYREEAKMLTQSEEETHEGSEEDYHQNVFEDVYKRQTPCRRRRGVLTQGIPMCRMELKTRSIP